MSTSPNTAFLPALLQQFLRPAQRASGTVQARLAHYEQELRRKHRQERDLLLSLLHQHEPVSAKGKQNVDPRHPPRRQHEPAHFKRPIQHRSAFERDAHLSDPVKTAYAQFVHNVFRQHPKPRSGFYRKEEISFTQAGSRRDVHLTLASLVDGNWLVFVLSINRRIHRVDYVELPLATQSAMPTARRPASASSVVMRGAVVAPKDAAKKKQMKKKALKRVTS